MRWAVYGAALVLAGLVLGLSQAPHVWALRTDWKGYYPEKVYSGFPKTYGDEATTYLGWIRQAREGHFLMIDRLTPEEHPRNYFNLLFWPMGVVAGSTGLSEVTVYSLARVIFGAALLILLWCLALQVFKYPPERLVCFLFLVVAGGWEGLAGFLERNLGSPHVSSPAWWTPQISTFFSLMGFPHLLASFVGMIATVLFMARAWSTAGLTARQRDWAAVGVGAGMAVLTMFHPFDAFTLAAILWTTPVLFSLAEGQVARADLRVAIIATALWLPVLLLNIYIFTTNPALEQWNLQNIMTTSSPDRLLIAAGISGLLTLIALTRFRSLSRLQLIMVAWVITVPILIHMPVRFQRRMLGGIQFPLAVLAATAVIWLGPRLLGRWLLPATSVLVLAALILPFQVLTPYYVFDIEWGAMRRLQYPSWLLHSEWTALDALDGAADESDVVLASYEMGNFVPWRTGARAFLGHYALTMHAKEKRDLIQRFFAAPEEDDAWRRELINQWRVTYVLDTPHERALGGFDPATRPWLREIFSSGDSDENRCRVFKVIQPSPRSPAS